jgi:hypothetical protein
LGLLVFERLVAVWLVAVWLVAVWLVAVWLVAVWLVAVWLVVGELVVGELVGIGRHWLPPRRQLPLRVLAIACRMGTSRLFPRRFQE